MTSQIYDYVAIGSQGTIVLDELEDGLNGISFAKTGTSYTRQLLSDGTKLWTAGEDTGVYYATPTPDNRDSLEQANWTSVNPNATVYWGAAAGSMIIYKGALFTALYNGSVSGQAKQYVWRTTVDSRVLYLESNLNMEYLQSSIVEEGGGASAFITGVDTATNAVYYVPIEGEFTEGNRLFVGNLTMDNTKKYLKFDNSGNISDLLDAPQEPAYTTTDANPSLTFTFPSTFGTGNAPDVELVEGCTFNVQVTATNTNGTNTKVGSVQPGAPATDSDSELVKALQGVLTPYVGEGIDGQPVVTGVDNSNKKSSLWLKGVDASTYWAVIDNTRQLNNYYPGALDLATNKKAGYQTYPLTDNGLNTDGFTLRSLSQHSSKNANYIAYNFQCVPKFFDQVIYTGSGNSATQAVPHNLETKPGFFMTTAVQRDGDAWVVYHATEGAGRAAGWGSGSTNTFGGGYWNNQEPTDRNFSIVS